MLVNIYYYALGTALKTSLGFHFILTAVQLVGVIALILKARRVRQKGQTLTYLWLHHKKVAEPGF